MESNYRRSGLGNTAQGLFMSDYAIRNQDYKRRNTLTKTKKSKVRSEWKIKFQHFNTFEQFCTSSYYFADLDPTVQRSKHGYGILNLAFT